MSAGVRAFTPTFPYAHVTKYSTSSLVTRSSFGKCFEAGGRQFSPFQPAFPVSESMVSSRYWLSETRSR